MFFTEQSYIQKTPSVWNVGDVCVSKSESDDIWKRVEIIEVLSNKVSFYLTNCFLYCIYKYFNSIITEYWNLSMDWELLECTEISL